MTEKTEQASMKNFIKSLTRSELFDLGWFFRNAVLNAQAHTGSPEREFARCLTAYTGNDKLDTILMHISREIKFCENHPIVFAKTELYKLLNECIEEKPSERSFLLAQISTVQRFLDGAESTGDPVGVMQYKSRLKELNRELFNLCEG